MDGGRWCNVRVARVKPEPLNNMLLRVFTCMEDELSIATFQKVLGVKVVPPVAFPSTMGPS